MSMKTYIEATRDAIIEEMNADPTVYCMAEDIKGLGGGMGQYKGIAEKISNPELRILDAPISETAIVSSAVGAAFAGMRPIIDLRFSNCLPCCMDEIVNQAAKSRYMFGGQAKCHFVLRCPDGLVKMHGAHHTDSLEAWFAHIPGLQVCIPSNAAEAKGLLKTAIRNDNPVMFFEHKLLFSTSCEVPDEEYTIPFGQARIAREGTDVTIVAYGIMVSRSLEAAEQLQSEGISAEVIDLRTVSPWDKETVLKSVAKTGRVVVTHEAVRQGGFGGEIAATIAEEGFASLKAPILRVAGIFTPTPLSPGLEDMCRVLAKDVYAAAVKAVRY